MASKYWWLQAADQVVAQLKSDSKEGISHAQARRRLKQFGPNALPPPKQVSLFSIFFTQFTSFIIWVLIVAAVIAGYLGEWVDSVAILIIVIINGLLGFVQEWRSIRSMEALTKMEHPVSKVIREGKLQQVPIEEVVPGDLLVVESGDRVPADARLITAYHLKIQEAALTGESVGVSKGEKALKGKNLPLGDRLNMIYRGTTVVYGKGIALVTETGLETEIGKIARLLESIKERKTPLQVQLTRLGHRLVWLCLGIVVVIFLMGYWKGFEAYEMLMLSLSLAVAAIPEGLPAVVTISLAIGMQRMARRRALVRRLSAVETLGCTTVICTDKTGTLTENTMRVKELWVNRHRVEMTGSGYDPSGEFLLKGGGEQSDLHQLLEIAVVCNSAGLEEIGGKWEITGDPTEAALLVAAKQAGITLDGLKVVDEIPFDSERRMMSVTIEKEGKRQLMLKGAPEAVLSASTRIVLNGEVKDFSSELRSEIEKVLEQMAARGLRVLAMASGEGVEEKDLVFVGLVAMQDPPRAEAKDAMEKCIKAGIHPIMVTGDHKQTARAIGQKLALHGDAIDGAEMEALSDAALADALKEVQVFSRVSAQHKMRIVDALQSQGEVVAMAGGGVNDAPAIQKADIGVAMGITGTDVTKSVSDMVILDDNFESIVAAVEEGRGIFDNMVKFISYLLSCNLAEILVIFFSVFFMAADVGGIALVILAPIHLLWINLITDGLPAVALAMDPISPHAMERPPRDPAAPFLSRSWVLRLASISLIIACITFAVFIWIYSDDPLRARTAAFTVLVLMELSKPFILRLPYKIPMFSNAYLIWAVASSFLLQMAILYVPILQVLLKTASLMFTDWMWILGGVLLLWLIASPIMNRANAAD